VLREWRESDLDAWAAMYADPEVTRYLGGPIDRQEAWARLAMHAGQWALRGYGTWAVQRLADGAFLGRAGLWRPEGWPGVEVTWAFTRAAWGHGYATEAGAAQLDYAWRVVGLPAVVALIHPDNSASMRVARRLGLSPVGEHSVHGQGAIVFGLDRPRDLPSESGTDR
jgi:RimJ/RimL family protein N-acetyltransferase